MLETQMADSQMLAAAYQKACIAEIEALKPGNVHIFADGHGMEVQDFARSAQVSSAVIASPDLTLGERIFNSIEATWGAVQCNTNLGIVLLCAPIMHAALALQNKPIEKITLRGKLTEILHSTTVKDAQWAFEAIKLANPAGLGSSEQYDVYEVAACNLYEAMQAAQRRDFIAMQYANDYSDIFDVGLQQYEAALALWHRSAWATTATYLFWMANYADSHVVRKYGDQVATNLQSEAAEHLSNFLDQSNPKQYQTALLDFDRSLKLRGINPGTSADLTVATWLVRYLLN